MNSSPNRASNPPDKSRRKDVNLDLSMARQMLPLVRSIVSDIVDTTRQLAAIVPEQETLDEHRRLLTWNSRQRRYALQDELRRQQERLNGAVNELDNLGLLLVDPGHGQVDFPTRVNGRPAAFSWQMGEDALNYWRYPGEDQRRPIPADWQNGSPLQTRREP